jgi:hypothetical protein
MEPPTIDPYAPPKSTLTGTSNTTYLKEDGYAFQNELVANKHFKSPLICAKLGIHIPAESKPVPKQITVTRTPRISKFIASIFVFTGFILLIAYIAFMRISNPMPTIILYILLSYIIKRIFTKRYRIPFFFSDHYTRIRARRKLIFSLAFLTLFVIFLYGFNTQNESYILFSFFAFLLTLLFYKYKITLFVVTQTKGDYHYIRGVHQNLLDELPHLPLSS